MTEETDCERIAIYSLDEIPDFESEDEEPEWWATHEFSKELLDSLPDMTEELDRIAPLPETTERKKRAAG